MDLAVLIFVGGMAIIAWIYLVSRQERKKGDLIDFERLAHDTPIAAVGDGLLVAREHGRLIYINPPARRLFGMGSGMPNLERISQLTNPSGSFLQLFTEERQLSFQLGKYWVEASSHRVPSGEDTRMVVVVRELKASTSRPDVLDVVRAMQIINEIGETINASMSLEEVLQTLLIILKQGMEFDAGEICLWDSRDSALYPRGWFGDTNYVLRLSEAGGRYFPGEGITGWIAVHRKPVLLGTRNDLMTLQPKLPNIPYRSFVAVPLMLGDRFVGTLEVAAFQEARYSHGDLALLQAVSKPFAVAIYNSEIYSAEVRRVEDMAHLNETVGGKQPQGSDSVNDIFRALNRRVAELISAEMCGVFIYDEDRQVLAPRGPFFGLPDALIRSMVIPLVKDSPQRDIWERQSYWISNDVDDEPLVAALGFGPLANVAGITSTAWLPLMLYGERIGVMVVSNKRSPGGFGSRDIKNLQVLAGQASVVVGNIYLFERGQRMDKELQGLQELTNAIGALSHETEFYGEITRRIARVMDAEMCGIMLYQPETRQLVSRPPFYGVPDALAQLYVIDVPQGHYIEQLWQEELTWFSNRVQSDTLTFEAGLDELAAQIGVTKTLMAVLVAGGRRLGVLQISNKINGEDFNENDVRLVMFFATQTAAFLENARLFQAAQRSAEEAQGLRRIAELAGVVLTSQENYVPLLSEIAKLTETTMVFVNVLEPDRGHLVTYPRWIYGTELAESIVQDIYVPGFEYTVVVSHEPLFTNSFRDDTQVIDPYKEFADKLGLRNGAIVPLVFGDRTMGEFGVANRIGGKLFEEADLQVLRVIAAQIAAALDRLGAYEATGQNLIRRMEELDAISAVSNELTVTLELERILSVIRENAVKATKATDGTVIMLDEMALWRTPEEPRLARRLGYEGDILGIADIEYQALTAEEIAVVADYEFTQLGRAPFWARSAIAVRISYLEQPVGVIHLFHTEANQFDDRAATFLMTLAVKGALAYGNYTRYQEQIQRNDVLRRRVEQLNRIFELGHMFQTNTDPVNILEAIAYSVQQSVGFDSVLMCLVTEDARTVQRVAYAGLPVGVFESTRHITMTYDQLTDFLKPAYRLSESYFFPAEKIDDWYVNSIETFSTAFEGSRSMLIETGSGWRDGDRFIVLLYGSNGDILGAMSLDRPYDNRRPDRNMAQTLEIFAHQAASTIENTRLYLSTVRSAEQEARLNEVMEAVAKTLDIPEIMLSVAEGALQLLPFMRLTVALQAEDGFDLIHIKVQPDQRLTFTNEEGLMLRGTALLRAVETASDELYRVGDADIDQYVDLRRLYASGERISLLLPLLTGGECLGAVHIGSDLPDAFGFEESRPLLKRMAQLVAGSVQNARLFNEAIELRVLNESVLESIQQGIIVLDDTGKILSANQFMRQRFGWDHMATGENLFGYRPQLRETLQAGLESVLSDGIPQERLSQLSTTNEGQVIVSNYYLYPLRFMSTIGGVVILVEDVTERARLEQAMESRANQLSALTEVSTRITSSLARDDVVQIALEEMSWLINHEMMSLWRRNGSYMVLEGVTGEDVLETRKNNVRVLFADHPLMKQVVDSQRVISVGSTAENTLDIAYHAGAESWMGVPLVSHGHVSGLMMLSTNESQAFESGSDRNIALAFASQVAIAEANADLFQQTFERTSELGTLLEAVNATSLTTDLDSVFRTVVELMFSQLDMDRCTIMTWDEVDNRLQVQFDVNRMGQTDNLMPNGTLIELDGYPGKLRSLRDREVIVVMGNDLNTAYTEELAEVQAVNAVIRMLVPLVVREKAMGLIQLDQHQMREELTQQKVRLASALGSQMAIAIENARLSAETTAHFEESLIINDLSRAISSSLDMNSMIGVVRDQLPNVARANELYIALYDAERSEIVFPMAVSSGEPYSIAPRKLTNDEVSFVIRHRRPLNLGADYYSPDQLRASLGITNGEPGAKSYLGVPLLAGDQVYGVLAVRDTLRTRAFTINEQRILTTVASQLGVALQNARLFQQIQQNAERLNQIVAERTMELEEERDRIDTLYQITSELARTLDKDRLMPRALSMVAKAVGAQDGVIMQLDPITDQLYSTAVINTASMLAGDDEDHPVHIAESVARWLIEEDQQVTVVHDLHEEDYWDLSLPGAEQWHSAIAVLLETNEELMGVMVMLNNTPGAFEESHLRLMVAAANQVASSINNAELYELIREQTERLGALLRQEQETSQKNKSILEGITDGVVLADAEGRIVLFNPAAERILRVGQNQVMNVRLEELMGDDSTDAGIWARELAQHLVRLGDTHDDNDYIDQRIDLGGQIISMSLSPVYTGEKFLGTVSVFRDITREVEVDRIKGEFIASVSHEFRTPLTPIKGYTEMLLMGAAGQVSDMQKMMLGTIKENIARLTTLVEDVLRISEVDAGRSSLSNEPVYLNELLESIVEMVYSDHPQHRAKEFVVVKNFDPDLPAIEADLSKITRVLFNLVDNAFNYTPAGGTITLETEVNSDNPSEVLIRVADTGVGIPEDFRERIWRRFERHEQTTLTMDVAGTGLGLPIAKEFVRMHQGEVWFDSQVGGGSTFYVRLPVKRSAFPMAMANIVYGARS